jgi:hypothetical protein
MLALVDVTEVVTVAEVLVRARVFSHGSAETSHIH